MQLKVYSISKISYNKCVRSSVGEGMQRQLGGMFYVFKSNAKYNQERLKQSKILLQEMRLVNASQNCKEK